MIIQLVYSKRFPKWHIGSISNFPFKELKYAAYQGNTIGVGATRIEAIKNCMESMLTFHGYRVEVLYCPPRIGLRVPKGPHTVCLYPHCECHLSK